MYLLFYSVGYQAASCPSLQQRTQGSTMFAIGKALPTGKWSRWPLPHHGIEEGCWRKRQPKQAETLLQSFSPEFAPSSPQHLFTSAPL